MLCSRKIVLFDMIYQLFVTYIERVVSYYITKREAECACVSVPYAPLHDLLNVSVVPSDFTRAEKTFHPQSNDAGLER